MFYSFFFKEEQHWASQIIPESNWKGERVNPYSSILFY